MKRDTKQGKDGIFGQGLPGTGGDIAMRRDPGADDAERLDKDVEGHLYTGGPKTQGEFARRGPGENPHGER